MILPSWSNNGEPEDPGSVTPISHPPWRPPTISQVWAPALNSFVAGSLSLQTFITSPDGWWIPTWYSGKLSDLSQPAKTLSQSSGISLLISTRAKSEPASLALNVAPLIVMLVGPLLLFSVVAQTVFGLIHPNLKDQAAGLL